jgi:hypothetical protein
MAGESERLQSGEQLASDLGVVATAMGDLAANQATFAASIIDASPETIKAVRGRLERIRAAAGNLLGLVPVIGPTENDNITVETAENTLDISEVLATADTALVDRHTLLIKSKFLPLYGQYDYDMLKLFYDRGATVDLRDIHTHLQELTEERIAKPDNLRRPIRELIASINGAAGMEVIQTRLVRHGDHSSNIYGINPDANFVVLPEVATPPEYSLYEQIVDLGRTDRLPPTDEATVIKIVGSRAIEVNGHTYTFRERALFAFNALLLSRGLSPPALLRAYPEFQGESTHFARGISALQSDFEEAGVPGMIVEFGTTHNRLVGFNPNIIFEDERRTTEVLSTPEGRAKIAEQRTLEPTPARAEESR